jgi:hypothetical protein
MVRTRGRSGAGTRSIPQAQPITGWAWLLVLVLTLFVVAPLTYPGFFEAYSGFLPPLNSQHLSDAPSWARVPDPVRGEGRLPYLVIWPILQLSGSGIVAIKWGYALAFFLGALGAYAWTRRWCGARGGILAATVYTYLPWHLGTVYVRGAYAEAWLWALWPLALVAIDLWAEGRLLSAALLGLPALAATFWTQPGLAALCLPLLAAYILVVTNRKQWALLLLVGSVILTLSLAWYAGRLELAAQTSFDGKFLYPYQLLSAAWGPETASHGEQPAISFQLGLAATGLTIVALALWASKRNDEVDGGDSEPATNARPWESVGGIWRVLLFSLVVLLLIVLLVLPLSSPVWRITGLDALLTAPWQVLALAGLPLALLSGSVLRLDQRLAQLPAWAGLVAFVVLASYPYLNPEFTQVDPGPEPVAMLQPVGARSPEIMILDAQVAPTTEITSTLALTLTWQAVAPVEEDHTIFVHLLSDIDDTKLAQLDVRPCDGECPTNTWRPGEILVEQYTLAPSPPARIGPARLAIGLYLLDTGERAAVVGRDDQTVVLHVP